MLDLCNSRICCQEAITEKNARHFTERQVVQRLLWEMNSGEILSSKTRQSLKQTSCGLLGKGDVFDLLKGVRKLGQDREGRNSILQIVFAE